MDDKPEGLLDGRKEEILATLRSNSIAARGLRQNNPFAGPLGQRCRRPTLLKRPSLTIRIQMNPPRNW